MAASHKRNPGQDFRSHNPKNRRIAFTFGTNHLAHAGSPADKARQAEYDNGPYAHPGDDVMKCFAATAPVGADVADVARAIVNVVDMPFEKRPFRVHIDPAQDVRKSSTE
jgi:hypothetical protein